MITNQLFLNIGKLTNYSYIFLASWIFKLDSHDNVVYSNHWQRAQNSKMLSTPLSGSDFYN